MTSISSSLKSLNREFTQNDFSALYCHVLFQVLSGIHNANRD